MRLSDETREALYMAALGLAIGFIVVVTVMGVEFVHILTRVSSN